jgi:ankyrin repeat protein
MIRSQTGLKTFKYFIKCLYESLYRCGFRRSCYLDGNESYPPCLIILCSPNMERVTNIVLDTLERKGGRLGRFIEKSRKTEVGEEEEVEKSDGLNYKVGPGKLHDAIKDNSMKRVNQLLADKYDPDEIDSRTGYSPLHVAAMTNNKSALIVLLKSGAELMFRTKTLNTVLHLAVNVNEPLLVRKIIESAFQRRLLQKLVSVKNKKHKTALDLAEDKGFTHVFETIQAKITEEEFVFAVENVLKTIVADVKSEATKHSYGQGRSPLHFLCLHGGHPFLDEDTTQQLIAAVPELVKFGGDPNDKDSEGRTPLHCACFGGSLQLVKAMMRLEEVKKSKSGGKSRKKLVDLEEPDNFGWTALMVAVDRCKENCVKELLKRGADIKATLPGGMTVLHILIQRCEYKSSIDVLSLLLDFDADPRVANDDGLTPLDLARLYGIHAKSHGEMLNDHRQESEIRDYRVETMLALDDVEDSSNDY